MFGTGKVVDTGKVLPLIFLMKWQEEVYPFRTINELTDRYGLSGMRILKEYYHNMGAGI